MSLGYTELEYNGVRLVNCQTLKFEQTPIVDQASRQTTLFDQYTVRVSGYFLGQYDASTHIRPKDTSSNEAGEQFIQLKHKLSQRRKHLKMTLGVTSSDPTVILEAWPLATAGTDVDPDHDVMGGPEPKVLSVTKIVGNASVKVEFEVTCHLPVPCNYNVYSDTQNAWDTDEQFRRGVLSNKWSCADELSENFWTIRTWVGELKLAHVLRNPHEFRSLCVPPVQPGMRRARMSFLASEDNLTLRYQIRDEEVYMTAPDPALSVKITHKEHVSEWSMLVRTSFSVSVKGDRLANKKDLVLLCMRIADGKLRLSQLVPAFGVDRDRPVFVKGYEVVEESGTEPENSAQLNIQLVQRPPANQVGGLDDLFRRVAGDFGRKLDGTMIQNYVNELSRGNRPGEEPDYQGSVPLVGAFVSHLQDACTEDHSMFAGNDGDERELGIIANSRGELPELPLIDGFVVPSLPNIADDTFNDSHSTGLYTHYDIDSEYQEFPMVVQLPYSQAGSAATQQSGGGNEVLGENSNSDEPHSAFVRIGPTQHQRTVRVVAQRLGQPPRMPAPVPSFTDEDGAMNVLLSHIDNAANPERTPDGEAYVYTIRGEYKYGLDRPPKRFRLGKPDYESKYSSAGAGENTAWDFDLSTIFSSDHPIG